MKLVIVPDYLREIIDQKLDEALTGLNVPDSDRKQMVNDLLNYYDENGEIPEFSITKTDYETKP